ncbi:MAG: glycosyltransferase family 4 protein [Pseudomonadota bacterium]
MLKISEGESLTFRKYIDERGIPTILQVLPALNTGGVEQGVIDVSAAIVAAGGQSIVVSNGGQRVYELQRHGATHIEMPVHSKNPLIMYQTARRLHHLILEHDIDIVHACSRAPAWVCAKAVKDTPARFVTSCHAAHKISGGLKRRYNSAIAKGERVIAVSHFLADYLENEYNTNPTRIRVIHRGIPVERFHPNSVTPDRLVRLSTDWRIPEGAQIILMPARLTRLKGHMYLVDALAALKNKDVFCIMLGAAGKKSDYYNELVAHIEAKGLSEQIRIVDNCSDIPAAYMISTVVVAPSLVPEGFGRVPIEAQAMGRPIIATDHGGTRETIIRDETGWLIKTDDAAEFSKALYEALNLTVKERAILATRGMAHIGEHFTVEQMCHRTLDVYAELLNKTAQRTIPAKEPALTENTEDQDSKSPSAVDIEYDTPKLRAKS